jgi:Cupin domain
MPKIAIDNVPLDRSTGYPPPFNKAVEGRQRKRIGRTAGLTQFGVNICTLKPGAFSSQRHWHENEDELVYVLEGEVVGARIAAKKSPSSRVMRRRGRPAWRTAIAWSTAAIAMPYSSRSAPARRRNGLTIPTST